MRLKTPPVALGDIARALKFSEDRRRYRLDLSGVGTAIVDLQPTNGMVPPDILGQIEAFIFSTLPSDRCAVSVVIPLHNEEEMLPDLVRAILTEFSSLPFETEFLFCENGSVDRTREIARAEAALDPRFRVVELEHASYGAALRAGIESARADVVVIFNADLWCRSFFLDAIMLLQSGYDIVIGSKRLTASLDKRPFLRRLITWSFNTFLSLAFGFEGTDTHGMKALRRSKILDVLRDCKTSKEVFDTELVLRAQRSGVAISEVPTSVVDTRPARLSLLNRVPSTLRDLWTIRRTL